MNDAFGDLMRRADPAGDVRDRRSEDEIAADLKAITGADSASLSEHGVRRRWMLAAVPALAAMVTALAIVVQVWSPFSGTAAAATPPLLELAPTTQPVGEVMDRALARLDAVPAEPAERRATSEGWYLQTDVDSQQTSRSAITPQVQEVVWDDDLSGTVTLTAGQSYAPADRPGAPLEDDAATPPGTILSRDEFGPGKMPVLFQTPPPVTREELRDYLQTTAGIDPTSADAVAYFGAIRALLGEWTLGPDGHAALLGILIDADGLTVAGDVTDRLGRPGTALRMASPSGPHFEHLLVVSRDTGRIIAAETIYLGGLPELDVTAPCVIDYTAWT